MSRRAPEKMSWSERRAPVIGLWLLALALSLAVILHTRFTADMSAFLPEHPTAAQAFLVDQIKDGAISRMIAIVYLLQLIVLLTSSHYTLLDLAALSISPDNSLIRQSVHKICAEHKGPDGGVNPSESIRQSDVCINGMFLNYAAYFGEPEAGLESIIDFILEQQMQDGGFNCRKNRSGARHSSLHSTLSVLEGILEYSRNGYRYRVHELERAESLSREFILRHRLFKSDHTGTVIHPELLKFSFPPRWKYNVLRVLDYFRKAQVPLDERMEDAIEVVIGKRRSDGRWPLQAEHPGSVHFHMERPREPSRWNTLIALRVLRAYRPRS